MSTEIIISADFTDATSPIMTGSAEDKLTASTLRVSDAKSSPLLAVKMLGGKFDSALVINHFFDAAKGWTSSRKNYIRSRNKK